MFYLFSFQVDKNLENVTHEQAVATLKSVVDKVTLVVGKTAHSLPAASAAGHHISQVNSHSTGAINTIGQTVVDYARSSSTTPYTNNNNNTNAMPTATTTATINHSNQHHHHASSPAVAELIPSTSRSQSPLPRKLCFFLFLISNCFCFLMICKTTQSIVISFAL